MHQTRLALSSMPVRLHYVMADTMHQPHQRIFRLSMVVAICAYISIPPDLLSHINEIGTFSQGEEAGEHALSTLPLIAWSLLTLTALPNDTSTFHHNMSTQLCTNTVCTDGICNKCISAYSWLLPCTYCFIRVSAYCTLTGMPSHHSHTHTLTHSSSAALRKWKVV